MSLGLKDILCKIKISLHFRIINRVFPRVLSKIKICLHFRIENGILTRKLVGFLRFILYLLKKCAKFAR